MAQTSTRTMARVIGPSMLIMGAAVVLRADTMPLLIGGLMQDGSLMLITAAFVLILGAVMITAHNVWTTPAAIVITLLGWITFVRGAVILLLPNVVTTIAPYVIHTPAAIPVIGAVTAALGAWLAFVGWFSKSAA